MSQPLISLVTSTYRAEKYLENHFEAICAQTVFQQMEVILVLNDPTPAESEIAAGYSARFPGRFQIIKVPRESIGTSTNRGYRHASGRYLAYADVDDSREPDSYERQVATLEDQPECDFTYGDFVIVGAQGEKEGRRVSTPEFEPILFSRRSYVGPGHFFRRELLQRCGYWDEQLRSAGDFDFQVRAALNGTLKKTSGVLTYYTRYANSGSASSNVLQHIERTVVELRYGIYDKIDYQWLPYAMRYNIPHLKQSDQWLPVSDFVPDYERFIEERAGKWLTVGIRQDYTRRVKRSLRLQSVRFLKTVGLFEPARWLLGKQRKK
jgi:glycosyltransferase involved in cell wall biosynthesis